MAKAKLLGMRSAYVPNAKADMRYRKKVYQRCREVAERSAELKQERRDRRVKHEGCTDQH